MLSQIICRQFQFIQIHHSFIHPQYSFGDYNHSKLSIGMDLTTCSQLPLASQANFRSIPRAPAVRELNFKHFHEAPSPGRMDLLSHVADALFTPQETCFAHCREEGKQRRRNGKGGDREKAILWARRRRRLGNLKNSQNTERRGKWGMARGGREERRSDSRFCA